MIQQKYMSHTSLIINYELKFLRNTMLTKWWLEEIIRLFSKTDSHLPHIHTMLGNYCKRLNEEQFVDENWTELADLFIQLFTAN